MLLECALSRKDHRRTRTDGRTDGPRTALRRPFGRLRGFRCLTERDVTTPQTTLSGLNEGALAQPCLKG